MKTSTFALVLSLLSIASLVSAQDVDSDLETSKKTQSLSSCAAPSPDHVFAEKGKSQVTFSTGIPYIGIAEYAYGVSSGTTIGLIYGQTPQVEGYGIRVRTIITEPSDNMRVYFKAPVFYYPQTKELGGQPWFLTWPTFNLEYKRDCGRRMWAGVGAVGAVCAFSLERYIFGDDRPDKRKMKFRGGLWNTLQGGITQPITDSWVAHLELGLVMKGFKVAPNDNPKGGDWVGGPPVIAVAAITYSF